MVLSDRIAIMRLGVLQQYGPPHMIYGDPVNIFVAGFIGSPQMNLLEGQLERDDGGAIFAAANSTAVWRLPGMPAPVGATRVTLGVRPEHVTLSRTETDGPVATISLVEPVGPTTFVDLEVGGGTFKASTDPEIDFQAGEKVSVGINPRRVYFFDPHTGNRLRLS